MPNINISLPLELMVKVNMAALRSYKTQKDWVTGVLKKEAERVISKTDHIVRERTEK